MSDLLRPMRRHWERPRTAVIGASVMTLLFQFSCMDFSRTELNGDELAYGDGYTWLELVKAWDETGQWSPFVAAHNAPEGLETHLTRPYAAVVLVLARVLAPWQSNAEALRMAGKLSGPLLHVATAAVLAWGAWRLLGTGGALLAAVAYLSMPVSFPRFGVLVFDHHAFHLFLTALSAALLIYAVTVEVRVTVLLAGLAGAVAALGIWSGVEMLVPAGIGGLGLGLAWVFLGGRTRARGLCFYALGMAFTLVVALVAEYPPSQWTLLLLDRVSAAHVLMGSLLAVGSAVTAWVPGNVPTVGPAIRVSVSAAISTCVALILWVVVPNFFLGPYGDVHPVVDDHLRGLSLDHGAMDLSGPHRGLLWYHLCLLAVVGLRSGMGLCEASRRDAWLLIVVALVVGVAGAFHQYRLIVYYEMYAAVALGGAAAAAGRLVWRGVRRSVRVAAVPVALLILIAPYGGWAAVIISSRNEPVQTEESRGARQDNVCDWAALGRALAGLPAQGSRTIATYAAPGPQLSWHSGRGVVATGCHRNAAGMRDARTILLASPEIAREVAERRGVGFVVQCPSARGWQGHDWHIERSGPKGVYARLARNEPPDWLVRLADPEFGVQEFVVWRTVFGGVSQRGGQVEPSGGRGRSDSKQNAAGWRPAASTIAPGDLRRPLD